MSYSLADLTLNQAIPEPPASGAELARLQLQHGVAAAERGDRAAAAKAFGAAMRLDPMQADAASNLAALCNIEGHLTQAEALCRAALQIAPDHVAALTNLGNALHGLGRHADAIAAFRAALTRAPQAADPLAGLGLSLQALGHMAPAIACFRAGVAATPACPVAHVNLAHGLLAAGQFDEGWAELEWRAAAPDRRKSVLPGAPWRGEPLYGRRVLVQEEGGYGDILQFARYVPLILQRGGHVVLRAHRPLLRLLGQLPGLEVVDVAAPLPRCDLRCSLLSLPRLFGTGLTSVPPPLPLQAAPDRVAAWRARIAPDGAFVVGLAWAGAPRLNDPEQAAMDRRRSMALADLAPLAGLANIRLVSLQNGAAAGQIASSGLPVFDAMTEMDDFADTAALAAACDLVISVDTAMLHLAGSLGRPVWLLDRYDGCWRWMKQRADSPWYPTLRLFRQPVPGDWPTVVADVAQALKDRISA